MEENIFNQLYKFNIENTQFVVTLDNSYSDTSQGEELLTKSMHFHTEYELFFLINGKLSVLESDGLKEYENCSVCIPPFFNHSSKRIGDSCFRFLFSFSLNKKINASNTYSFFKKYFQYSANKVICANIPFYLNIIKDLLGRKSESFQSNKIELLLKLLFYEFLPQKESSNITLSSYLVKIDDFIFNHFNENITLKVLASSINLCTKQASRIIMKNYHKPLNQLITEKRLNVACTRLLETDKSIQDIIKELNFNSESNFFKLFKKYYGVTPLQYKKSALKK